MAEEERGEKPEEERDEQEPGPERPRIVPGKNRELQYTPAPGRKLFDEARKSLFLEWFSGTANLSLSARAAGVHYRTVLRHRAQHEGFRTDFDEALAQGKVRVKAWLMEAKDDGRTEYDPSAHVPANLSAAEAMQLLRDDAQREAAAARAASGAGPGGRPHKTVDMEEVRRQLVARLRALGMRLDAQEAGEAQQPPEEPPPPSPDRARGWSCSGADCSQQPAALPGEGRPVHSPGTPGEDL